METAYFESPIGWMELKGDTNYITHLNFIDSPPSAKRMPSKLLKKALEQLHAYFSGDLHQFSLPLSPEGTDFRKTVWNALQEIPYGKTASYGDIAQNIDNKKAVRAVGGANHNNPVSIIIPCHRVIGSNGKLTGYAGGLERKEWLLNHEERHRQ